MEVVDKSVSITNIIDRFPSAITRRISKPTNEIIKLVAHNLKIENNNYLVFGAISKLDRR